MEKCSAFSISIRRLCGTYSIVHDQCPHKQGFYGDRNVLLWMLFVVLKSATRGAGVSVSLGQ